MKEIRIDYKDIQDPQTITDIIKTVFKQNGLDIHRHEVDSLQDDNKKGQRILNVKTPRTFFQVGDVPWKK